MTVIDQDETDGCADGDVIFAPFKRSRTTVRESMACRCSDDLC